MSPATTERHPLMEIRSLEVHFRTRRGVARAVNEVDLTLYEGERLGLVGESGSGKTTLLLALLQMISPPGQVVGGQVIMDGVDLVTLGEEEMRRLRLARIAMVPQGAMNSLNPVMRIEDQLRLVLEAHDEEGTLTRASIRERTAELLEMVGLRPQVARLFPHELSGGMKQRACIAMAISLSPRLILADEPTSALDVVVQRQIMQTLGDLQGRLGATVLLVGHDMGLMAQFAQRVGIMYGGHLVEVGDVQDIFQHPQHPYTQLLIGSVPSFARRGEFSGIPGVAMSLLDPPPGCGFHPRCPRVMDRCRVRVPSLSDVGPRHQSACLLHDADGAVAGTGSGP
ncbi:ABC transporter ATP-binding protein [Candidatus Latescibacterota bacterium]